MNKVNGDTLTLVPSQGPGLFGGVGFLVMGGACAFLAVWAHEGARSQRGGHVALCAQLGDQALKYDFCKPNAGAEMEGLAVLPAILSLILITVGAFLLYQTRTHTEAYVFDRATGTASRGGQMLFQLADVESVAVGRHGRSFTVEIRFVGEQVERLSDYLTVSEANAEAERVATYLGVPSRTHNGFFAEA